MTITVEKKIERPEANVTVREFDANLIKDVREKVGVIQAIIVARWLTKCSVKTAKDFVVGLE